MTALALLAILPAAAARSLGEPGTIQVPAGELVGLCGPAPDFSTAQAARQAVLAQHERLVRLSQAHDLVPVRPGAVFSDAAGVARHLRDGTAHYQRLLAGIAGCVEVAIMVRIQPAPAEVPVQARATTEGGLAYLRARRASARPSGLSSSGNPTSLLSEMLAVRAAGLRVSRQAADVPGTAAATVLVPRARLPDLLAGVGRTAAAAQDAEISADGPWPCYIFTAEETSDVPA